ncbi:hypothetical protein VZT92_024363 [Zoarces viviparus]|uniref:Uncharacterized protein n=1 Tax=Zoarces viviparus TaxID=48416 RepID=A0AAW1E1Z7_ZOAVI
MGAQPASSSLAITPPPPEPLPPMAGQGTEGRGETAEKTRHTRGQPLNTGVTVKGPENLPSSWNDIYAWLPLGACGSYAHMKRECTHLCYCQH